MEILLFWMLFGLVGLAIGLKKGLNPAMAVLGGILLGPFSILMVFVSSDAKKCPKCAEMVKKEAVVCKHCQHTFSERTSLYMALVGCPDCGGKLSTEAIACPHCGRPNRPVVVNGDNSGQAAAAHPAANPATGQPRPAPEQVSPPSNAGQVASPEMPSAKRCPACQKEIKPGATRCGHCFQAISATLAGTASTPPSQGNWLSHSPCKGCLKLLPKDTKKCPHCGQEDPVGRSIVIALGGGFLALCLLTGLGLKLAEMTKPDDSSPSVPSLEAQPTPPAVPVP